MENNNKKSLIPILAGSTFVAFIVWAASLTGALLIAMFATTTGKTTALFNTVFFEVTETASGADFSLGIESVPHTLGLLLIIWITVFAFSLLIRTALQRKHRELD